tara:strand:+ start:797 stop:1162 length:366 start_codon:yes stop_codon:yes gene_type:complete
MQIISRHALGCEVRLFVPLTLGSHAPPLLRVILELVSTLTSLIYRGPGTGSSSIARLTQIDTRRQLAPILSKIGEVLPVEEELRGEQHKHFCEQQDQEEEDITCNIECKKDDEQDASQHEA